MILDCIAAVYTYSFVGPGQQICSYSNLPQVTDRSIVPLQPRPQVPTSEVIRQPSLSLRIRVLGSVGSGTLLCFRRSHSDLGDSCWADLPTQHPYILGPRRPARGCPALLRPALVDNALQVVACDCESTSLPFSSGSATVFDDALARCHGSDLLTLRLHFAHMPAVFFVTSPTFWKVNEACLLSDPSRHGRSFCHAFRRFSFGRFFGNRQSHPLRAGAQ
jgi:hypothetical protein